MELNDLIDDILRREGGYVDHPNDPGGATNFGITLGTLRNLDWDVNKDGSIDKDDVKGLSQKDAKSILLKNYFKKPKIDLLPEKLIPTVFDMYVNAGARSVSILQNLLKKMGYDLVADGVIGPVTVEISHDAVDMAPLHLVDAYGIERRNFYFRLGDSNPKLRVFVKARSGQKGGWILRAEEFVSSKYHLTQAEFEQRIASWG